MQIAITDEEHKTLVHILESFLQRFEPPSDFWGESPDEIEDYKRAVNLLIRLDPTGTHCLSQWETETSTMRPATGSGA